MFPPVLEIELNPPLGIIHPEKGAGKDGWPFKVRNPFQGQTKHPGHMVPAGSCHKAKKFIPEFCLTLRLLPPGSHGQWRCGFFFTHSFEHEKSQGCRLGLWGGRTMTVRRRVWPAQGLCTCPPVGRTWAPRPLGALVPWPCHPGRREAP